MDSHVQRHTLDVLNLLEELLKKVRKLIEEYEIRDQELRSEAAESPIPTYDSAGDSENIEPIINQLPTTPKGLEEYDEIYNIIEPATCNCDACNPDNYGWALKFIRDCVPAMKPEVNRAIPETLKKYSASFGVEYKLLHDEFLGRFQIWRNDIVKESLGGKTIFG